MQESESKSEQAIHTIAVNSSGWQRTAIAVVITALIFGAGGYLLGQKTSHAPSQGNREIAFQPSQTPTKLSPRPIIPATKPSLVLFAPDKTFYTVPTTNPELTADWKTFTSERGLFTFRYLSKFYTSPERLSNISEQQGEEEVWFVTEPRPTTTLRRLKAIAGLGKGPFDLFVVAVETNDDIESLFDRFILSGIKNTATYFKYEGIRIAGKTGRVVSAYTTDSDGKRWHYRNIDIPLVKNHLNITYYEYPSLIIDEFNQVLSTFKFTDQR